MPPDVALVLTETVVVAPVGVVASSVQLMELIVLVSLPVSNEDEVKLADVDDAAIEGSHSSAPMSQVELYGRVCLSMSCENEETVVPASLAAEVGRR